MLNTSKNGSESDFTTEMCTYKCTNIVDNRQNDYHIRQQNITCLCELISVVDFVSGFGMWYARTEVCATIMWPFTCINILVLFASVIFFCLLSVSWCHTVKLLAINLDRIQVADIAYNWSNGYRNARRMILSYSDDSFFSFSRVRFDFFVSANLHWNEYEIKMRYRTHFHQLKLNKNMLSTWCSLVSFVNSCRRRQAIIAFQ